MGGRGSSGASAGTMSLDAVGRLQSGNVPGMTVAQEFRMKEAQGKYTASDYARAAQYGQTPKEYQASITDHIKEHGQINPVQASHGTLDEGYHRYAAARQLGRKTIRIRKN